MNSKVKKIIALIGVALCVASIIMLCLPAATSEELILTGWNMVSIQFIFQYGPKVTDSIVLSYGTSPVAIILILMLILGTLCSLASFGQRFANNNEAVKILGIISLVCLIVSGVLFFLLKETCTLPDALPDFELQGIKLPPDFTLPDVRKSAFSLGVGPISGGITSLLAAICCAIAVFVPEKN